MSCDTSAIYIQGRKSKPLIRKNTIMYCRCNAIQTMHNVNAKIYDKRLILNEIGIEVKENMSKLVDNKI